jgi:hypothetical protein
MSDPTLRRAFLLSYALGAVLCVLWPLVVQGVLGRHLQPGILGAAALAEDLGYTFTGLVVLGALFVHRRSRKVRAGFAALDPHQQPRVMAMEILLYSAIFQLSVLFGLLYHGLGGAQAERYGRTFIALGTVMFLVFVPRLGAWRKAAGGGA